MAEADNFLANSNVHTSLTCLNLSDATLLNFEIRILSLHFCRRPSPEPSNLEFLISVDTWLSRKTSTPKETATLTDFLEIFQVFYHSQGLKRFGAGSHDSNHIDDFFN